MPPTEAVNHPHGIAKARGRAGIELGECRFVRRSALTREVNHGVDAFRPAQVACSPCRPRTNVETARFADSLKRTVRLRPVKPWAQVTRTRETGCDTAYSSGSICSSRRVAWMKRSFIKSCCIPFTSSRAVLWEL